MGLFFRGWLPAVSLLAAASAAPAAGQRIDPDRIFEVTVEVDGRMMSAMIQEGSSLKLTLRQTDEYNLSPVLRDAAAGRVLVAVSRGAAGQPRTQRIVERLELTAGVPVSLRSAPTVRIVLDRIRRATPGQDAASPRPSSTGAFRLASAQSGSCCVCCGDACACACGVSMSCGHCCSRGCCDPIQTGNDRTPILTGPARFASFTRGTCTRGSLLERAPAAAPAHEVRTALR